MGTGGAQALSRVTFPGWEVAGGRLGNLRGTASAPNSALAPGCPSVLAGQAARTGPAGMAWGVGRDAGLEPGGVSQFDTFRLQSRLVDSDWKS